MKHDYPPGPVTLTGSHIQILPMDIQHLAGLQEAVKDGELWKLWYTFVPNPMLWKRGLSKHSKNRIRAFGPLS